MRLASKLAAALAVFFCCLHGFGQAAPISGQAIDQNGAPLPFAQVRVCSATSSGTPCQPTTFIYYDYNLQNVAPNPYTTDQYGNYTVYAPALPAPNLYAVQLAPASGITWTYVQNGPYCSLSGCTFTGPITAPYYNATQFPYYEINGVQISSSALSDASNLAYINKANVFTMNQSMPSITGMTTPLPQSEGGTGTASGTGYAYGNGTSGFTYSTTIPYASITGTPTSLPCTAGYCVLQAPTVNQAITQPVGTGLTILNGADMNVSDTSVGTPTSVIFSNNGGLAYYGTGDFNVQNANAIFGGGFFATSSGANFRVDSPNSVFNSANGVEFNSNIKLDHELIDGLGSAGTNGQILQNVSGTSVQWKPGPSPTLSDQYNTVTGCSYPNDGANLSCTMNVTMGTAMADTSYIVSCTVNTSTSLSTVVLDNISPVTISSVTAYSFSEITQGSSTEWTANPNYGKTFICHAHHN